MRPPRFAPNLSATHYVATRRTGVFGRHRLLPAVALLGAACLRASVRAGEAAHDFFVSLGELVATGLRRSRVVLMNEAHDGLRRSIRARIVGLEAVKAAHAAGVRALAVETLTPELARQGNASHRAPSARGYLDQPEMKRLIQTALDLGWTLIAYEADDARWAAEHGGRAPTDAVHRSLAYANWREKQQAENLRAALNALAPDGKLLVWCGNGHRLKTPVGDWRPTGYWLARGGEIAPFAIDQTLTARFNPAHPSRFEARAQRYRDLLRLHGGTAGFLREAGPAELRTQSSDAFILSLDNDLE